LNALRQYGQVVDGNKLNYNLPFPVGMDTLKENKHNFSDRNINEFIESNIPNYNSFTTNDKKILYERVKYYLKNKKFSALTFDEYQLQGTPSAIVVDRRGILRNVFFGANNYLPGIINQLVNE